MLLAKNLQRYAGLARFSFSSGRTDYYQVLGLSKTASSSEILSAFSQSAEKVFPSVDSQNSEISAEAGQQYRQIAEAYAVLSHLESRNNYDLLNKQQPERLYGLGRAEQEKYTKRDHTGQPFQEPNPEGSYAHEKRQVLAEERKKFNVDYLGRYQGGLPQKGKGPVRASVYGSALAPPGAHHDNLIHNEKTETHPDGQTVTNEMANHFNQYAQQSRYEDMRRWPAFQAKVDYDYFQFKHYQLGLQYIRNILIFFFGLPGLALFFLKWRNQFALSKFIKLRSQNTEAAVDFAGQQVVVGKRGAIKYA